MSEAERYNFDLGRMETFVFFAAMLLAVVMEGACVYWLGVPGVLRARPGEPSAVVVQWTASTLPQCWLLGVLVGLLYRIAAMLIPPRQWGPIELQHNRRAFLRLWSWAIAVGSLQIAALYLDRLSPGVQ